jgi:hypothetical protein
MQTVYRLALDRTFVDAVQRATLSTKEFGIEPTEGLFGSVEWWARVESGELSTHKLCEVITKVYMSGMGDFPEFQMRSESGEELSWQRFANSKDQDSLYEVGRRVELDYVVQRHRPKSWDGGAETKCVLEVRVGDHV